MTMRRTLLIAAACLFALPAMAQKTKLTVYTALENEQLDPYKKAAEAAIKDIDIAWVRDSTGVVTARLIAEKDNPRADVIWGLSVYSLLQMDSLGMLEPYTPVGADKLKPAFRSTKNPMTWTGMDIFAAAVCFNTVLAEQKKLPKPSTWQDLLNPVYKGQIVMPNPNSSGTGFLLVAGWLGSMGKEGGWSYMDKLHDNISTYLHSGSAPCSNAAKGEFALGLSFDMRSVTLKNQGAPIDIIVPSPVGYDLEGTAIVKGTKNLAAAKKLADFAVTPEAAGMYGDYYALLGVPGVTAKVENYPADFEANLVKADFSQIAANRADILKEWASRYDSKSAPKK
jgi:iron(III) transport system substrate-binding protein